MKTTTRGLVLRAQDQKPSSLKRGGPIRKSERLVSSIQIGQPKEVSLFV